MSLWRLFHESKIIVLGLVVRWQVLFPAASFCALLVVQHLPPNRTDLPLLLNGIFCRICADFGADANVIGGKLARKLGLSIDSQSRCPCFELPTFKRLLKPFGKASITCEFGQELASRASEVFLTFLSG